MHLRSGKALKEMARPTSNGTISSLQSSQSSSQAQYTSAPTMDVNVSTAMGATMAMPVSTEIPATVLTTDVAMTWPGIRFFVPPFTTSILVTTSIHVSTNIHVSPHAQIRARLDGRFFAMQNFTMSMTAREQPYGMPTSIRSGL